MRTTEESDPENLQTLLGPDCRMDIANGAMTICASLIQIPSSDDDAVKSSIDHLRPGFDSRSGGLDA